jgi:hypothetical protein
LFLHDFNFLAFDFSCLKMCTWKTVLMDKCSYAAHVSDQFTLRLMLPLIVAVMHLATADLIFCTHNHWLLLMLQYLMLVVHWVYLIFVSSCILKSYMLSIYILFYKQLIYWLVWVSGYKVFFFKQKIPVWKDQVKMIDQPAIRQRQRDSSNTSIHNL